MKNSFALHSISGRKLSIARDARTAFKYFTILSCRWRFNSSAVAGAKEFGSTKGSSAASRVFRKRPEQRSWDKKRE
jgi:hypothetical protein